ncbi:MAG: hypothetical protein U1E65_14765 [Myxococcota bacterium]
MSLSGLLLLGLLAAPALESAAVTGTSSGAADRLAVAPVRVEQRLFDKDGRLLLRAAFAWWARDDLRLDPGLTVEGTYYLSERLGLDLSGTGFFSTLDGTAGQLRRSTGRLPDSQAPIVRAMAGARWAFAYGKFLLEGLDMVVHADLGLSARAGVIITDVSVNPSAELGAALQIRLGPHALVAVEADWLGGYEKRTRSEVSSGLLLAVGLGLRL